MGRRFTECLALGLIVAFAPLQGAQAGERHAVAKAQASAAMMSGAGSSVHPAAAKLHNETTALYSFTPVNAMLTRGTVGNERSSRNGAMNQTPTYAQGFGAARRAGPATAPAERKTLTFFRLNSKFGAVSVQPVVGGVNGAQLSLGF